MAGDYKVYRLDRQQAPPAILLQGFELRRWAPSLLRPLPPNLISDQMGFAKNWLFHLPTMMVAGEPYHAWFLTRNPDVVVAQCLVTGPSTRFPFMGEGHLQIGLV